MIGEKNMFKIREVKSFAKRRLKNGNCTKSIAILLILKCVGIIYIIPSFMLLPFKLIFFNVPPYLENSLASFSINVGLIYAIVTIITIILGYGALRWFYLMAELSSEEESIKISEIFYFFKSWKEAEKTIIMFFSIALLKIMFYIVSFIAVAILFFSANLCVLHFIPDKTVGILESEASITLGVLLMISWLLSVIVFNISLFPVNYIIVSDDMTVMQYIYESIGMMKDNYWSVIRLYISFIPWFISCIFILPIFFVIPYFNMSMAVAAQEIISMDESGDKMFEEQIVL